MRKQSYKGNLEKENTMKVKVIIVVSLFMFIIGLAGEIQDTDNLEGIWFIEFNKDKSIAIFTEGEGEEEGSNTLLSLHPSGMFSSSEYTIQDGKLVVSSEPKGSDLYFFDKDTLLLGDLQSTVGMVFKRIKNRRIHDQVKHLTDQYYQDLSNQNISEKLKQTLKQEIKSISWNQLHMSTGEYMGWLTKKKKLDWEKKMRESGQEIKFPVPVREDTKSLALIKGQWLFNGKLTFIFTDTLVGEAMGVKLYRLEIVNGSEYEGYDLTYTVLIHEKDGQSYIYNVFWQFEFQRPSRIEFQGTDKLVTYHEDKVDATAVRQ